MRKDKTSWKKTVSLGALLLVIWVGWGFAPHAFSDLLAASIVQLQPGIGTPNPQKTQKESSKQEFHTWVDQQLITYEESEQKHLFLLEKSVFYTGFQTFLENAQAGWIIYRPSTSGSAVVWVKTLAPVQKGAPVIIGDCLVGFVDAVQGLCARIRLVSDTRSKVAVEIKKTASSFETEGVNASMNALSSDVKYWQELAEQGVFHGAKKVQEIQRLLKELESILMSKQAAQSLPLQGLLCGSSSTWPSERNRLLAQGFYRHVGFKKQDSKEEMPSIEPGDLLITSGLDGRYPPGLRVGYVYEVRAQDPAKTLFEVQASMALADFSKEKWVWILPAMTSLDDSSALTRGL